MKYYGLVGYVFSEEMTIDGKLSGVFKEVVEERPYYGDVVRNTSGWQNSETLNDDRRVNVRISIVSDPFAIRHFSDIRYVHWMGNKWKVTSVEPVFPRLNLDIGGVYNEQTHGTA